MLNDHSISSLRQMILLEHVMESLEWKEIEQVAHAAHHRLSQIQDEHIRQALLRLPAMQEYATLIPQMHSFRSNNMEVLRFRCGSRDWADIEDISVNWDVRIVIHCHAADESCPIFCEAVYSEEDENELTYSKEREFTNCLERGIPLVKLCKDLACRLTWVRHGILCLLDNHDVTSWRYGADETEYRGAPEWIEDPVVR